MGAAAGVLGVGLTGVLVSATLAFSGEALEPAAGILLIAYSPLAAIEGAVTGATVVFLGRVAPEVLNLVTVRNNE